MPATPTWFAVVEAFLNRGIESSAQATALAHDLEATSVRIDAEGLAHIRASVIGGRIALGVAGTEDARAGGPAVAPAATISGSPLALLHLARRGANRDAAHKPAQIRGDAEIADRYRKLFSLARPDLEEELSRIVGDFPARRLSQFARRTASWIQGMQRTAGENIAEYLQEESRDLVNKTELDEFLQDVDGVREAADRLEARLARLEQQIKGSA